VSEAPTPLEAALELARRHGLPADEARLLKDGSNVLVHLAPTPVVVRVASFTARIRGDPRPYLEREVALARALSAVGAAVAPPSDLLPPGPHRIGDVDLTALAWVEHEPGRIPEPQDALAALDRLHHDLRRIDVPLPLLGPATSDLDLAIAFAVEHGLLDAALGAELRGRRDELVERLLGVTDDRQALHGDAFPRNSLLTSRGVVWIDFEDACSGPVAWDRAVLLRHTRHPAVERELRSRDRHGALDLAIALRTIQADVWTVLHTARAAGRFQGAAPRTPG
jgi:hypothetical protein